MQQYLIPVPSFFIKQKCKIYYKKLGNDALQIKKLYSQDDSLLVVFTPGI
jgi:hypothetical protein